MNKLSPAPALTWRIFLGAVLALLSLYILFDIPNRFFYQEKGWSIPTDPREKAAYDFAHSLQIPPKPPQGGFKYLKVNENFDYGRAVGKDNPTLIETIIPQVPQPQAFNFAWARFKSLFWLDEPVRVQYFKHLCDTEAGEYIYKTVDKVDGIYQMRPMPKRSEALMQDRYGFEDPADWNLWEADVSPTQFVSEPFRNFNFFESFLSPNEITYQSTLKNWIVEKSDEKAKQTYWHYYNYRGHTENSRPMKAKPIEAITALYAYTWRGIKRSNDRQYGIAGGEMFVINRQTKEILGFRRSFAVTHPKTVAWGFAAMCPKIAGYAGRPLPASFKDDYSYYFVNKMFQPLFVEYIKHNSFFVGEN